jgi:serine/threonine protein kinase
MGEKVAGLNVFEQNTSETASKDPLIGKQLGDYRITSRLAAGGMARIYKGMDYKLQRPAAVKVLELHTVERDQTLTARFKREARAVAALEHPNIIPVYQYGEDEDAGVYFLAMKLIKGRDLAEELRRIRKSKQPLMPVERALNLMGQIAAALDYAHAQDIIHRDVKPSNILIDKDDRAVLTDLGLVLRAKAETTLGTAFGTPRYIAPEQATSSDKAVPQSDIYSFAVILYELLTGQTPFDGSSPMEIALAHISDPVPPPRDINPDIPPDVEQELLKALHKDPRRRHKTATALIDAVRAGYGLTTEPAPPAPSSASASALEDSTLDVVPKVQPAPQPQPSAKAAAPSAAASEPQPAARLNPMLIMVAVALLIAGAFIINGIAGGGQAARPGAPVTLIYDDTTFTMINEGDYTLNLLPLRLVRGVDDNIDDFAGDRVPRDILPPDRNCYQIVLSSGTPSVPPQCSPISEHRHGQETLYDPLRVPWRSETADNGRIASFEVRYNGALLARCDTVARGQHAECRFTWPEVPESPAR